MASVKHSNKEHREENSLNPIVEMTGNCESSLPHMLTFTSAFLTRLPVLTRLESTAGLLLALLFEGLFMEVVKFVMNIF